MAHIQFEDGWVTITSKPDGPQQVTTRFRAGDIKATRYRSCTTWRNGELRFTVPPSYATFEGRAKTPARDDHSIEFANEQNAAAAQLLAAIEQARS
ncbi:hypothetical protein OH540_09115 [Streptomyces sp. BPPL-273]|uniref:hypothetical protein n=1 Tax=Streptomyces sp. BPPL-273 TaxID=2987533 RepID=UPI0024AEFBAD|nr:hypothetical protein [Streptomyces sp. BPPL-273]WHM30181.1 hypothetical protein OH540_09115 [Streptomyces sp. BPPL-273]